MMQHYLDEICKLRYVAKHALHTIIHFANPGFSDFYCTHVYIQCKNHKIKKINVQSKYLHLQRIVLVSDTSTMYSVKVLL